MSLLPSRSSTSMYISIKTCITADRMYEAVRIMAFFVREWWNHQRPVRKSQVYTILDDIKGNF